MIYRVAAKVFIRDDSGSVLLLRRSSTHPRYALQWDIPGGFVEEAEPYELTLQREVQEETGLALLPDSVRLLYAKTNFYERRGTTGEPETVVRLYYGGRVHGVRPGATISWEHDQATWVAASELSARLVEPFSDAVAFVQEHGLLSTDSASDFTAA